MRGVRIFQPGNVAGAAGCKIEVDGRDVTNLVLGVEICPLLPGEAVRVKLEFIGEGLDIEGDLIEPPRNIPPEPRGSHSDPPA